jgi:hypothetical protein
VVEFNSFVNNLLLPNEVSLGHSIKAEGARLARDADKTLTSSKHSLSERNRKALSCFIFARAPEDEGRFLLLSEIHRGLWQRVERLPDEVAGVSDGADFFEPRSGPLSCATAMVRLSATIGEGRIVINLS